MDIDKIIQAAQEAEQLKNFEDTPVKVLHDYDGTDRDKEMLSFIYCCFMTSDPHSDKEDIEKLLATVRMQTPSVWDYIDRDLYMIDFCVPENCQLKFATQRQMFDVLTILNGIIMTTQTIERSSKIALDYNHDLTSFFVHIFNNAEIRWLFSESESDPQEKICMFLKMMVRKSPVDLGIWGNWLEPAALPMPINSKIISRAIELGIINMGANILMTRNDISRACANIFPEDPVKGWYALISE